MKLIITSIFFTLSLFSCAQSSKENYDPTSIVGCWDVIDSYHIIESNFASFDSLALIKQIENKKRIPYIPYVTKYTKDAELYRFVKETKKVMPEHTGVYIIEGDSIFRTTSGAGGYRVHRNANKLRIDGDTMYTELNVIPEVETTYTYADVDKVLIFPEDFKIKKAVRVVKSVRVKNCSDYKEN